MLLWCYRNQEINFFFTVSLLKLLKMVYWFDFPNLRRWGKSHVNPMGRGRGLSNFRSGKTGLFFSYFFLKKEEKHICTNFFLIKYNTKEIFFFKFSKSINCIVAQNGVKRQKHLNFRFKTDFAPLPWASKSIKIVKKWMKMIDMIEIRFALYYFSHFLARKKYW